MAQKKEALFQWNRKIDQVNVGGNSRKKDSINDWIQKVQAASDDAIKDVLGEELLGPKSFKEILPDDEAIYEAQELVDGWMKESSLPNLHKELDYRNETWTSTTGLLLHDDDYLNSNENNVFDDLQEKYFREDVIKDDDDVNILDRTEYPLEKFKLFGGIEDDDDIDDALLVQDVLHGMLTKDFTKNIDLGMKPLAKKAKNPVPKMDIRHQQVKLKGEKRRKKYQEKKEIKLTQEEIAQKARARIVLEEKQRIQKERLEEKAIIAEMEKIKIDLADEKKKIGKEAQRKKNLLDEAKLQIQTELRKQREEDMRKKAAEEELRQQIQQEMEKQALDELRMRMKILHKYFSAWYNVVVEQRLRLGKAKAIADWKCKIRAWNAWKAYVSCVKSSQEARDIEQTMKEKYRKEQMSIHHSNKTMMRKCFGSWVRYTRYRTEKAFLKWEHEEKTKRMAMFLEAAAKGDLWERKPSEENEKDKVDWSKKSGNTDERNNTAESKNVTASFPKEGDKRVPLSHGPKPTVDMNENLLKRPVKQVKSVENNSRIKQADHRKVVVDAKCVEDRGVFSHTAVELGKGKGNDKRKRSDNVNETPYEATNLTERSDTTSVISDISTNVSRKSQIRSDRPTTKPLHLAMEERHKERVKRKTALEEERKKREEERLEVLRAKEAERLMQEQLEKDEKIRQKQEQRKLEALKQKEKELQIEQSRLKNSIAKEHYEKTLLRKYGIEPLARLVQINKLNIQISDKYHNSLLLRRCLAEWHIYTDQISTEKREKADRCYQRILKRRALQSWLKCRFHLQNMNKIARSFSLRRILARAFNAWQEYVTDERILMWSKESDAEEHDTTRMLKKCLTTWIRYVKLEKEERDRERRKDELRKKVQLWLPDYKGDTSTEEWNNL